MNCSEIQEQLSAYHDGELSSEMREVVAAHIAGCETCASQLDDFKSLTNTFQGLTQPEVPPTVWAGISTDLDQKSVGSTVERSRSAEPTRQSWLTYRRLALAASILLLVGAGFWMNQQSDHSDSGHAEFAMVMDHYLETLANDPDQAEQFLLEKYDGTTIDPDDAVRLVGYRPAVASGLPDEYRLASTSVLKMPCCTCVKTVCKRKDGSTLVLFEHDDEEAELLGDRPTRMETCGDAECSLVDLDSSIAATWKRGSRWVTAVGVRDTAEIGELVTWLENKTSSESQPL